jgi:4'-phosphopantetheinyl transferase
MVACAVTIGRDVGVDVEHVRRSPPFAVATRFFAPGEVAVLRALALPERAVRFYECWTLKESDTKARGLGLAIPLAGCAFHRGGRSRPISASFDARLGDDPRRWQFHLFRPTPWHVMALSLARPPGGDVRVEVRETLPLVG